MPSRRSVPGDFPEAPPWLTMSSRSSEIWKATPTSSPNAVSAVDQGVVDAGEARPEPGGGGDQRAGLVGQHAEVVGDRVLAGLGADGLLDLAGDQPLERLRLDPHGLRAEVGEQVRRPGEQQVAGQDGDAVGPPAVGAGRTPPHGGLVHDVVVVQRRQVGQLADHGRPDHLRAPPGRRAGRPAARASAGTACRPPTSGGRPPRATNGCSLPTAVVSADSTRTRPSASDAPSAPSGSQGPMVDAGVDPRCQTSASVGAVDCGTGSGHQPTKIAARSARSSTAPGRCPAPGWPWR